MERRQPAEGAVEAAAPGLTIRLLGGFAILRGDVPLPGTWRTEKARALVKLLALAPGHALHRDQVLERLWPEQDPAAAANNLYFALHAARRVLDSQGTRAATSLTLRAGRLCLAPPGGLATDVAGFEEAARAALGGDDPACCERALERYTGDLLPEDRYADWATGRRENLRETFLALLARLADLHARHGDWAAAILPLERIVAEDPAREAAHNGLMRAFALTGQRSRALRQYTDLRAAMRRDLDAEPDPATQALYAAILAGDVSTPAPVPAPVARQALPLPPTRLLGRASALAAATALLADDGVALLTITGPGGVGKSHFALALAHQVRQRFRDGGYFVPLAAVGEPGTVPTAVARTLGLALVPRRPIAEQIAAFLGSRRVLLLLDNFEHLLPAATTVECLLAHCPNLVVVVTSRAPLRLRRERELALTPLALPAAHASQAAIAASPAVCLLAERAGAIRAGFAVTAENGWILAAICRRLDGLPLALELAAARLRVLTPAALLAGLEQRAVALRSVSPDLPPRHRTLAGVIAWSYDLLAPAERRLFRCLGVFQGGATLAALAAVAGAATPEAIIDGVEALVAQSMVQIAAENAAPRLVPLETLRAFALDWLAAKGEDLAVRDAHAAYYAATLDGGDDGMMGPEQARWQALLADEEQNVRAALAHLAGRGDAETGLRLWWSSWRFWSNRGQWGEARAWLDRLLALGGSAELRAQCLFAGGLVALWQRDDAAAPAYLQACLNLSLAHDFWRWQAAALTQLGNLARRVGDPRAAVAHHREALALRRERGNDREIGVSLCGLGYATADLGELATAEALLTEALGLLRAWGDVGTESDVLCELADIASRRGDQVAARAYLVASLERWWQLGAQGRLITWLTTLAARCADVAPPEVLRLLGALRALVEHWRLPPDPAREASAATLVAALRERLGPDAEVAWAGGAPPDQAAITALATAVIARQAAAHGPRSRPAP